MVPTLCWAPVQPRGGDEGDRAADLDSPPLHPLHPPPSTLHRLPARFPLLWQLGFPVLSGCLGGFLISPSLAAGVWMAPALGNSVSQGPSTGALDGAAKACHGRSSGSAGPREPEEGGCCSPELGYDPDITRNIFTLKNSLSLIKNFHLTEHPVFFFAKSGNPIRRRTVQLSKF